jgi:hypothetical protein
MSDIAPVARSRNDMNLAGTARNKPHRERRVKAKAKSQGNHCFDFGFRMCSEHTWDANSSSRMDLLCVMRSFTELPWTSSGIWNTHLQAVQTQPAQAGRSTYANLRVVIWAGLYTVHYCSPRLTECENNGFNVTGENESCSAAEADANAALKKRQQILLFRSRCPPLRANEISREAYFQSYGHFSATRSRPC